MQTNHQKRIEEMMRKAGQEIPNQPTLPPEGIRRLRATLILEEALETIEALGFNVVPTSSPDVSVSMDTVELIDNNNPNLQEIVDGCGDTSVVTIGTLSACGVKDDAILEEIDNNNLAKFGPGGYRRDDGKWIKPPNHAKPKIKELLEEQSNEQSSKEMFHHPV